MATKDWVKRKFQPGWNPPLQPEWNNKYTGERIMLNFEPENFFWSIKHPVGKYEVFIYNKQRTTRKIPVGPTTKSEALKFAKEYMRKH